MTAFDYKSDCIWLQKWLYLIKKTTAFDYKCTAFDFKSEFIVV